MAFELTFLGSSGGPIEGSNCCILIKPSHISYQDIVERNLQNEVLCVDAGAGLAKLSEVIFNETHDLPSCNLLNLYNDSLSVDEYFKTSTSKPFAVFKGKSPFSAAVDVFKNIKSYLISHPHLDHIYALVLNSPNFTEANPKEVYGSCDTVHALNSHIFNGIIWPNMQEFEIVNLNTVGFESPFDVSSYSVKMFKLSHGKLQRGHRNSSISINENFKGIYQESKSVTYVSSAFLISYKTINSRVLVFGDFESDHISNQNFNEVIWKEIVPMVLDKSLSAIVLECSNCNCVETSLYGHLNPIHLMRELYKLNGFCVNASGTENPLKDMHVIINHVKETDGVSIIV
ncbi:3',5'-cyclic-nucleotide phosphodiesterase pde1 [Yamadazyma tenuis]|uniref:3',5'-cyclic-nucleotide phosphodiesterase pde1 n=1 Tax=Candida tenuis TaxID=2315449 RepID=UPI00279A534F|nr:3',5'-cyclic-nucleotide phosphodiesterase pde1 [Yamadazyma tenuis]